MRIPTFIALSSLLIACAPPSSGLETSSRRLVGGVAHSEILPPMPPSQAPGKVFRGGAGVQAGAARLQRFRVPPWLVGVWQRTESTEVSRVQLPSGRHVRPVGKQVAMVTDSFGTYRDAQGQVWQTFDSGKASGSVDRGAAIDYHTVGSYDLFVSGRNSAVVEVRAKHTVVNKKTRKIISAYQDEELNTYTLVTDGRLRTDSSVKVFDHAGRPLFLTRSVSSEVRTRQFKSDVADKAGATAKIAIP